MHPFEAYLKEHNLEALNVSVTGRIRYMTVYNATKGIPITPEHAQQIRLTVFQMSGVHFTGNFVLTHPAAIEELPTLQMKRLPKRNLI